jgi:hypothetical protein
MVGCVVQGNQPKTAMLNVNVSQETPKFLTGDAQLLANNKNTACARK